jgi:hypothetical protein
VVHLQVKIRQGATRAEERPACAMPMPRHGDDEADRQNMIFVILLFFIKRLIDGVLLSGGLIGIQPEF